MMSKWQYAYFCQECNEEISDDARYFNNGMCPKCGEQSRSSIIMTCKEVVFRWIRIVPWWKFWIKVHEIREWKVEIGRPRIFKHEDGWGWEVSDLLKRPGFEADTWAGKLVVDGKGKIQWIMFGGDMTEYIYNQIQAIVLKYWKEDGYASRDHSNQ